MTTATGRATTAMTMRRMRRRCGLCCRLQRRARGRGSGHSCRGQIWRTSSSTRWTSALRAEPDCRPPCLCFAAAILPMLTLTPACALPLAVRRDDRLPAVFTRHADPAALFAAGAIASTTEQKVAGAKSDAKGKGRATHAEGEDNDDDGPILPGVKSTWGELPRRKKTPSEKRLEASRTSGKKWFDLPHRPLASLSDAEKRELQALRLSNAMDPKRFMRGEAKRDGKKLPEYFQVSSGPDSSRAQTMSRARFD